MKQVAHRFMHELKKKDFGRPVFSKLSKTLESQEPRKKPTGGPTYYMKSDKWKDDEALSLEANWNDDAIKGYQANRRKTTAPAFERSR